MQPSPKKNSGKKDIQKTAEKRKVINVLDAHFEKYATLYFIVCILLNIIISLNLFDVKVSTGGDDSEYIVSAKKFLDGTSFPGWHGPFYPIFLSLLISIFSVKIILFKIFSFLFIIGHFVFFYYTFKNQLSATVLVITSLIISINSHILYFASQTYTEALYLFLQSIFFFVFIIIYKSDHKSLKEIKELWPAWLCFGLVIFLLSITRNIGIASIGAVIFFFLLDKKYWAILVTILSYLTFRIPFDLYKRLFWGLKGAELSGQLNEILLKNSYNSSLGTENFAGMVTRFWDNTLIYLSKHFLVILGFKSEVDATNSVFAAILIIALLLLVFIMSFRNNKVVLFTSVYLGVMIGSTFLALQTNWGQMRMIIIYAPLLILVIFWGLFQIPPVKKYGFLQLIILLIFAIIFFNVLGNTAAKIKHNQKVLTRNLRGNLYYGFTPDWQNFLKMSEWVGKNLPDSTVVVSRKPSMSFVYSKGKEFYPMYRFPTEDADTLVARLTEKTGPLMAIKQNEWYEKNIPMMQHLVAKPSLVAVVSQENDVYTLHRNDASFPQMESLIRQYQITSIPADSLLRLLHHNNKPFYGISPDTLLNTLRINKVEYAIAANLRAVPSAKTERIINTVQRYLYIIEMKYPGIFTLQHQVGTNDNEPALLYRINYNLYGFSPGKP